MAAVLEPAFFELLGDVRRVVDERLTMWISPRVGRAKDVSLEVGAAAESVERLALRGGKRMRAALVGAAHTAFGGQWRDVVHAMLAMELMQVYLLIHDDWMDDDAVRRGGPAVHVELRERLGDARMGDAAAILAGDLANAYAQEVLVECPLAPRLVLQAMRAFAEIQEAVVLGQLAEMRAASSGSLGTNHRSASVETVHELKTASYTVTGPVTLGAVLAGATDAEVHALASYGRPLGIAFQLRDDLLGVFGDPNATGKPVWNDIRQGKRTALVEELGHDSKLGAVLGRADATDAEVEAVVSHMETSGARARVEARIRSLCDESRAALASLKLQDSGRAALEGAIVALGERAS